LSFATADPLPINNSNQLGAIVAGSSQVLRALDAALNHSNGAEA